MIRAKLGLGVLGACALALSSIALMTSQARAEFGASWLIEDKLGNFFNAGVLPASVVSNGFEAGASSLLTKIAGTSVTFSCSSFELIGVKLEGEGRVTNGSKARFTGCTTKLNGATSAPCKPGIGLESGTIVSAGVKGLLVLHKGEGVTRIEPASGTTLATIKMSEECSIGENVPVIGVITLRDTFLELPTTVHFVNQGPLWELWTISKTAEHAATWDGTALVKLGGEHAGRPWEGSPG